MIIFMLIGKILQDSEPPCTPSAGVTPRRQERLLRWHGDSTRPGYKWQGIVIDVSRIARTSTITGQKKRRFSLIILPKLCSNPESKQLSQGVSKHTETFTRMESSPFSVLSQVQKIC